MKNSRYPKAFAVARTAMKVLHCFGVEYDINQIGFSPRVSIARGKQHEGPLWADCLWWFEREKLPWKGEETRELSSTSSPTVCTVCADGWEFEMTRVIWPSQDDYDTYAYWHGCESYAEAETVYGSLRLPKDRQKMFVPYGEMEKFLSSIIKYCW